MLSKPTLPDVIVTEARRLIEHAHQLRECSTALRAHAIALRTKSDRLLERSKTLRTSSAQLASAVDGRDVEVKHLAHPQAELDDISRAWERTPLRA